MSNEEAIRQHYAERPGTPPRPRMDEAEYFRWACAAEGSPAEWVAGEVRMKGATTEAEDRLGSAIRASLEAFVRRRSLGHVRGPQFAMRLPQRPSIREPDGMFIAHANHPRLSGWILTGPCDLAVEIVTPTSPARDYREKYLEYEAAGIGEYWIVDPMSQRVLAYRLADDKYVDLRPEADGKLLSSVVPGWWLQGSVLFREPTPPDAVELAQLLGVI